MCPVDSDMCAAQVRPMDASKRDSPSTTSTCERVSAPPPPHFSGNATPRNPSSPSFSIMWRGKVSSLSHLVAYGLISRSANVASVSRMRCCSSVRSKFMALLARLHVLAHPLDDVFCRCAGSEDLPHAQLLELGRIVVGNNSAAKNRHIRGAAILEQPHYLREQRHVRARENRQPDRIDVFL